MASRQQDKRDNSTSVPMPQLSSSSSSSSSLLKSLWKSLNARLMPHKSFPSFWSSFLGKNYPQRQVTSSSLLKSESTQYYQTILLCFPYQVITILGGSVFCNHKLWLTIAKTSRSLSSRSTITRKMSQSQRVPASPSSSVKTGFNRTQSDRKATPH